MLPNRISLGRLDLTAAGALLSPLAVVAAYFVCLHGPLATALQRESTRRTEQEMAWRLADLQKTCLAKMERIRTAQTYLADQRLADNSTDFSDQTLDRVARLASECGVVLGRWQPVGVHRAEGYETRAFTVQGTSAFPALRNWFALVESGAPQLDMTHFSIRETQGPAGRPGNLCEFECTLKLHLLRSDQPGASGGASL